MTPRERAERLAAALGVTVEVKRPKPRAYWRVYLDGALASGRRYGSGYHEEASAWTAASQALLHRAECLTRDLTAAESRVMMATTRRKNAAWCLADAERALTERREALARTEATEREASAEMDATIAAATPEARAAFAAMQETEGK